MTLLGRIAVAQDKVVFSGDKRLSDANGITDANVKVTRLGNNGVGGACGRTRGIHPQTGVIQRDTHQWLRDFFQNRDVNHASISDFKEYLGIQYQTYLNEHRDGKEQDNVDCNLFTIFMTYSQDGKQIDCLIQAHVTTTDGLNAKEHFHLCKKTDLILQGDSEIVNAVRFLTAAPLTQIYAHADIKALLTPPNFLKFGTISEERAIDICRFINRVCSEQATAITGAASTISPECDVLVLDKYGVRPA